MPEAIEEPYGSGNTERFVVSGSLRGPVGLFYTSAFIDLTHLRGGLTTIAQDDSRSPHPPSAYTPGGNLVRYKWTRSHERHGRRGGIYSKQEPGRRDIRASEEVARIFSSQRGVVKVGKQYMRKQCKHHKSILWAIYIPTFALFSGVTFTRKHGIWSLAHKAAHLTFARVWDKTSSQPK